MEASAASKPSQIVLLLLICHLPICALMAIARCTRMAVVLVNEPVITRRTFRGEFTGSVVMVMSTPGHRKGVGQVDVSRRDCMRSAFSAHLRGADAHGGRPLVTSGLRS